MPTTDIDDLRAEIERLRAENADLRSQSVDPPDAETVPSDRVARTGWWRALISAVCIVLAGILVPVSVVGTWARAELVSEDAFVQTFGPLADDPDVQQLVIDQASAAVNEAVDVAGITNDVIDGVQSLDLPPTASSALDLLRQPAVQGVQGLIDSAITGVVQSDAFPQVWRTALVASHRALVAAATGDDTTAIAIDDTGALGIQLGPIIDELKTQLSDQGFGLASSIPTIDQTIVIVQADGLLLVGTIYNIAVAAGYWIPFIALGLAAVGVLVARRRSTALLGVGVAITIGAGLLAVALTSAAAVLSLNAPSLGIPARTLEAIYYTVVGAMRDTATVLTFLGVVVAVAAWLSGRWAPARRVRALAGSLTTSARVGLRRRGLDTGGFGEWMRRQRVLVRMVILVLAVILLFALRPLTFGDIVLVVVLALVVWLIASLLEKDPAEAPVLEQVEVVEEVVVGDEPADSDVDTLVIEDGPVPAEK
ncbi:hypothetical protein [Microbacterium aquimaris]|uniref:Uncharacterized protein n=1 Tax=Microbacterium aquimaris TaxID=459816 RepID=A0ABU5N745_9MICO|nr:hypothetical protein [Microbacterium aquimaris]MDZ8161742.1 hypothetical protein [Microbacterium aquimaris]